MKVLISVVLFAFVAVVKAQQEFPLPDYYDNNYDIYDNNYNDFLEELNKSTDLKEPDSIQATQELDVPQQTDTQKESDKDEFADYQIEDNRSESSEKQQIEENKEEIPEEPLPSEASVSEEAEIHKVLPLELPGQSNEAFGDLGLDDDVMDAVIDDEVAPLPVPEAENENNDNIFEETKDILNQGQDYLDELDQSPVDNVNDDKNIDQIIEETNKLLAGNDDAFDGKDDGTSSAQLQSDEEKDMDEIDEETDKLLADNTFDGKDYETSSAQQKSDEDVEEFEEDTPAKVYADLNADLDKLFETFDKLGVSEENEESDKEAADNENVEEYEEKNGKPFNEDIAMSWRNADDDAAEPEEPKNDEIIDDIVADENVDMNEAADNFNDEYEVIDDSNLSQIFAEIANITNGNDAKETTALADKIDENKEVIDDVVGFDNYDERSDSEPNADDDIDSVIKQIFDDVKEPEEAQTYGNDGLVDEEQSKEADAVEFEEVETKTTNIEEEVTQKTIMVDELNSAELSDLMSQFVEANKENFDVNSENFAKHVKVTHVLLKVDEPTVITSPDYPDPYEPGVTIDWMLEGPGSGIELNVTDLDINGASQDYLLIKPGGLDAEGTDGLIFSYHLNSEKRYRFTDVNRMFVRFHSQGRFRFNRGFSLSVRLIGPPRSYPEDEPEAEPVANAPEQTLTLNLAGVTLVKFLEIKDQFLELLADMAKEYIKDRKIDIGMNTTHEVTQITRTAVCNIQWPEYETCVEVVFGVPLHYEEEQEPRLTTQELDEMWTGYIVKEQFSERLRSLGITEYAIPNDRTVLMVWLVIAAGVVISMAMLAFALWRFSCFEDYTRMQAYGDTDSIQNEKRHLDLYPTPHQTLPPLYSENDYKWADEKYDDSTRVDMGGFANRSYIRDDIYDLDSDEDVIPPRDSKGAFSPRDYYDA